jgi:hypothetical protein
LSCDFSQSLARLNVHIPKPVYDLDLSSLAYLPPVLSNERTS